MIAMTEQEFLGASQYCSGGICVHCEEPVFSVEPDAEKYRCEFCGKRGVYGYEQALIMGFIEIIKEDND